jgi:hypothetical protein
MVEIVHVDIFCGILFGSLLTAFPCKLSLQMCLVQINWLAVVVVVAIIIIIIIIIIYH